MFAREEKEVVLHKLNIEKIYLEEQLCEEKERAEYKNDRQDVIRLLEDNLKKVNTTIKKIKVAEER